MSKMPRKKIRFTKEQILEACEGCFGIKANVYRKLHMPRRTFFDYCKRWPEIEQRIDEELQHGLDFTENQLMLLIQQKDFRAITFYLERKGADRGWGVNTKQQVELTSAPLQPIICFHNTPPEKSSDEDDGNESRTATP
jgi:hypothetical protein